MRILFFQYGDYGAAYRRLAGGGSETYRDQESSVDFVASLSELHSIVTVAVCDRVHEEILKPNLVSIGMDVRTTYDRRSIASLLDRLNPDIIICRTPHVRLLEWASRKRVATLPVFADLFRNRGFSATCRNLRLALLLRRGMFPCVANHNLNASRSVGQSLFVPEYRVVPWDLAKLTVADQPKTAPAKGSDPTALFCGMLAQSKGLGDCLDAVRLLKLRGIALRLTVAGSGELDFWRSRASSLGIAEQVNFTGTVAHRQVQQLMRSQDIVFVPTRWDYDEGLPNTIYEALAARTPLIMSDHPAFAGRLKNGEEVLVCKAANPESLAQNVHRLLAEPALYERLSQRSGAAHDRMYIGLKWEALIRAFISDPHNATGWVGLNSLTAIGGLSELG